MIIEKVSCPLDDFSGTPRGLHEHFAFVHPELVEISTIGTKWYYEVSCPTCTDKYRQAIRPGSDGEFASEYEEEIKAVALDILLNHYLGEHVLADLEREAGISDSGTNNE